MYASASIATAFGVSSAENATTGIDAIAGSRFCSTRNCHPSFTGIIRSSKMRSGAGARRKQSSASEPFEASTTSYPSLNNSSDNELRSSPSSSTRRRRRPPRAPWACICTRLRQALAPFNRALSDERRSAARRVQSGPVSRDTSDRGRIAAGSSLFFVDDRERFLAARPLVGRPWLFALDDQVETLVGG